MTEEDGKKQRPNAKYKLSNETVNPIEEEKLTFYYNRERRLANAPQMVQDLYKPKKEGSRFNLLRPLIADKPRATIFFTIVIMCIVILMLSILGKIGNNIVLDNNKLEISGTAFEGTTILVLKKTADGKDAYTGAVDIAVSVPVKSENELYQVYYHRVYFTMNQTEEYRFAVPFEAGELLIVLQSEKTTASLKIKAR